MGNEFFKTASGFIRRAGVCLTAGVMVAGLAACSSTPDRPKPAELPPVAALLATEQVWTLQMGESSPLLQPAVAQGSVALLNRSGTATLVDAGTGRRLWQV